MWGSAVVIQDTYGVIRSSGRRVDLGKGLKSFETSLLGIGIGVITTFSTRGLIRLTHGIEAVKIWNSRKRVSFQGRAPMSLIIAAELGARP